MLDSKKTIRLVVALLAIGVSACGSDDDKSNPVPVKDAGADAPLDAPADAKPDAPAEAGMPVDAGVDAPVDAATE